MKHPWFACVSQKGRELWETVERPTLRHSMHWHCGIYKNKNDHTPMSCMRLDHECACPLIRVVAVFAGLLLILMALSALCRHLPMLTARRCRQRHRCE